MVLTYMRDVLKVDMQRVCICLDDHPTHAVPFMMEGIMDEFDIFRYMLIPPASPGICSQELTNRFLSEKTK